MQRVYVADHPVGAHVVKGFLEESGIPAVVQGDMLFWVRGEIPVTQDTAPSVWVDDDAADRARRLIEEHQAALRRTEDDSEDDPDDDPEGDSEEVQE